MGRCELRLWASAWVFRELVIQYVMSAMRVALSN